MKGTGRDTGATAASGTRTGRSIGSYSSSRVGRSIGMLMFGGIGGVCGRIGGVRMMSFVNAVRICSLTRSTGWTRGVSTGVSTGWTRGSKKLWPCRVGLRIGRVGPGSVPGSASRYSTVAGSGAESGAESGESGEPTSPTAGGSERRHRSFDPSSFPPLRSLPPFPSLRVPQFISQFSSIPPNPPTINLMGRISSIRKSGKSMYFIDLTQDHSTVQIMASNKPMGLTPTEFHHHHSDFRRGDIISCVGHAVTTKTGQLSLKCVRPIEMLTPCINAMKIPEKLVDRKLINANKVLNYLVDDGAREKIILRSKLVTLMRQFFNQKQFLEVTTPIMTGPSTGANAKPFITKANSIDTDLQLRVAPELWLKRLVVAGFDKVYEIGYNFRNEGVDSTHNPEFTSCEFYCSYFQLEDLIRTTEDLVHYLYGELSSEFDLGHLGELTGTFERFEFIPTLEAQTGEKLPVPLLSENLIKYHEKIGLAVPAIKSPASLLDNLAATYLETINAGTNKPTIIYNHPAVLSPLSKSTHLQYDGREYDISLRFEMFIDGKEYINAYEEENSPYEQYEKFKLQQRSKEDYNDEESLIPDWNYVKALEYGLPPTGGWGCGIDRLAMLFSRSERIEEVLVFGTVEDVLRN